MYLFYSIALIVALFSLPLTGACPPRDYPWCTSLLTVETSSLPEGFTITQEPQFYRKWAITNTTSVPLYLFQRSDKAVWTNPDIDVNSVAPNYDIIRKFVDNKVFYWNADTNTWQEYVAEGRQGTERLVELFDDDPERLFAPMYQNLNRPTSQHRLEDARPPVPRSTFILLSYSK